ANWALFVLVSMQDDGLLILPTHRLISGLIDFDVDAFLGLISPHFEVSEAPLRGEMVDEFVRDVLPKESPHTFGFFDGRTRKVYQLKLTDMEILSQLEPTRSESWRRLDVAI